MSKKKALSYLYLPQITKLPEIPYKTVISDVHGQHIVINVLTANGVGYAPHVMYQVKTVNIAESAEEPKVTAPSAADIKIIPHMKT
jgi:hypothetical protein